MKAHIDGDRCQGHGLCAMAAPDVFDLGDTGVAEIIMQPATDDDREAVRQAALSCPEQAITAVNT